MEGLGVCSEGDGAGFGAVEQAANSKLADNNFKISFFTLPE